MRVSQVSLNLIADAVTGSLAEPYYEFTKLSAPIDIPRDTPTEITKLELENLKAGIYEIQFQQYISYDTTRGKYKLHVDSDTHTITIPELVHEPKDAHEVNPENQRVIVDHTGGPLNITIGISHATDNLLTVHYADLSIERKK
jgi:hypothetical protein